MSWIVGQACQVLRSPKTLSPRPLARDLQPGPALSFIPLSAKVSFVDALGPSDRLPVSKRIDQETCKKVYSLKTCALIEVSPYSSGAGNPTSPTCDVVDTEVRLEFHIQSYKVRLPDSFESRHGV